MGDRFKSLSSKLKGPVEYEDEKKALVEYENGDEKKALAKALAKNPETQGLEPRPEKRAVVISIGLGEKEIPGDELLDSESIKIREEKERQEARARALKKLAKKRPPENENDPDLQVQR